MVVAWMISCIIRFVINIASCTSLQDMVMGDLLFMTGGKMIKILVNRDVNPNYPGGRALSPLPPSGKNDCC